MSARFVGQNTGTADSQTDPKETKLVGEVNEVEVKIDGNLVTALCDTGSCVSTCSEEFYNKNLKSRKVESLNNILHIECADGNSLPYKGYIEAELEVIGIPKSKKKTCLFLVVPETDFNKKTPLLLGTNVLSELLDDCKMEHGVRFLQRAKMFNPWYTAFRCLTLREKELRRNKHRISTIRNAESHRIQIGPNQSINIRCVAEKDIDHQPTCAIITETLNSSLSHFLYITPEVVHSDNKNRKDITVNISNLTTNTVNIAPRAIIAELQPVTVDDDVFKEVEQEEDSNIWDSIHMGEGLEEEEEEELKDLLRSYEDIFSKGDTDIGHCDLFKHRIELHNETPFKQRHRFIPPGMVEEVRKHLEQLLAGGIIRKSKSPFASNIVLVRKKNGKLRMCVDYRMLNNRPIKDAYALPRVEEVFNCLRGKYFSTIDMKSGYHQVEMEEEHKERTAFTVGPLGFYEFNKMPFGLSNSPATYQRLMEECLGDYNMRICVIYLDDLIIFSDTFEQHLERLHMVLTRLRECGIKLSPEKCYFMERKVKFLGHVVGEHGIETDPDKIDKVRNYPTPKNPDELRSFLAFCGYYRKFVKDFAKVTRPLSDLLPPTSTKKKNKCNKQTFDWKWEDEHQKTFDKMKEILTSPPILAYPEFDKPFEVHTDASSHGLGAVLYQEKEGRKRVVAYASRSLTKSEKNYSAFKLEFLALKWAVTEKYSDYLLGNTFAVYTDNNPLTHILSSAKLDATGQRWVATLSDYDFKIFYRPGLSNTAADVLSRYPTTEDTDGISIDNNIEDSENIKAETEDIVEKCIESRTIKAICKTIHVTPFIEVLPSSSINIVEATDSPGHDLAQIELRDIRIQQREDPIIGLWYRATFDKQLPQGNVINTNSKHQTMRRHFNKFKMIRSLLYRTVQENGKDVNQLVLPSIYKEQVLQGLHNDIGHPGKDRTGSLVKERFYWPGYISDIEQWVQKCDRCLRRKSNVSKAPMVSIVSSYPLERVCMDFLKVDPCQGNIDNVLVITDHYTKFSVAVATRNQTAKTTAEALLHHFFLPYGIPSKLHSDQGRNFESDLIKELCKLMDVKKTRTTVYHPMCNGQTERFNRTLLDMLGTLEHERKRDWKKYLPSLVYAYNATKHESTGYTPFELMFGRKAKLPIDSVFHLDNREDTITSDYVKDLKERLETSHEIANKALQKARQKQKTQYDKKAKATTILVGDTVLVKILAYEGKHKIADKFEIDTYKVVSQPDEEIPVYVVRSESGTEKTLHRNHLLLIEASDLDESVENAVNDGCQKESRPVPKPRRHKSQNIGREIEKTVMKTHTEDGANSEENSESEGEIVVTVTCDYGRPAGPEKMLEETVEVRNVDILSGDAEIGDEETDEEEDVVETETHTEETVAEDEDDKDSDGTEGDPTGEAEAPAGEPPPPKPPPKPPPRKSTRIKRKPTWQRDYVVSEQQTLAISDRSRALEELLKEQASLNAKVLNAILT